MATQTSIDHYHSTDFTSEAEKVLRAIRVLGSTCISEVAKYINMDKSAVSGRFNELKDEGKIVFDKKRKSKITGIMSECWRVKQFSENLFN